MQPDPNQRLADPEQYINFVDHQDIDATTCHEDLKNFHRFTNIACWQIEEAKLNKSDSEKDRLEAVRKKGVQVMQLIGKKMRDLGIIPK